MTDLRIANVSRRGFLAGAGLGTLVLAVGLPDLSRAQGATEK